MAEYITFQKKLNVLQKKKTFFSKREICNHALISVLHSLSVLIIMTNDMPFLLKSMIILYVKNVS